MKYEIEQKDVGFAERSKTKLISKEELDSLTEKKVLWLVINNNVYDVGCWLQKHPGGDLIIRHFLFRDATDQFTRFHPPEVMEKMLPHLQIGVLKEPIKKTTELEIAFREFEEELIREGYYNTNYNFYILELIKGLSSFFFGIFLVLYGPVSFLNYFVAAFSMAFCWHQLAFVSHDTGHNGITHNLSFDNYFGVLLASCLSGLSIGWWKDSHNVHHVVTNDPTHDPDIQHLPFLAVTEKFFDGVKSTYHKKEFKIDGAGRFFVSIQQYLYYIVMMFARFNLYVQSIKFLLINDRAKYRKSELTCMIFFAIWFTRLVSTIPHWQYQLFFVMLTNGFTFLLHVQITLSHFAMDTNPMDKDEEFIKHQMRTSMDVECSEWLDWLHGGLQYQVVHHLFPRLPRHNLRKVRDKMLPFFKKYDLKYHCYEFTFGNIMVIKQLAKIARELMEYVHNEKTIKAE